MPILDRSSASTRKSVWVLDGFSGSVTRWNAFAAASGTEHAGVYDLPVNSAPSAGWYGDLLNILMGMGSVPDGWDGDGAAAPNQLAVSNAADVLAALHHAGSKPDRVITSPDGGVAFIMLGRSGEKMADIECFNTGEIAVLLLDYTTLAQEAWQINTGDPAGDWDRSSLPGAIRATQQWIG